MNPQQPFDHLSERMEWLLSTWFGALGYALLCALAFAVWGWDGVDRTIYISGAAIIVLLIGAGRRNSKAVQVKLDAITPGNELNRIEERTEREIEELRS